MSLKRSLTLDGGSSEGIVAAQHQFLAKVKELTCIMYTISIVNYILNLSAVSASIMSSFFSSRTSATKEKNSMSCDHRMQSLVLKCHAVKICIHFVCLGTHYTKKARMNYMRINYC